MSSIYIHIPYCKQKCHYCNFFTVISTKTKQDLIDAICKELELKNDYLQSGKINTIYFGGGTPSILDNSDFDKIFKTLYKQFSISDSAEISVEANPDDINASKLKFFKSCGVNRLSIGIQSFNDYILKRLNRIHTSKEAIESVNLAHNFDFHNLNIDLIYGIPGMDIEILKNDIKNFLDLNIPHLSAYSLTVEEKTTLHYLIRNNRYPMPSDSESIEHFNLLIDLLNTHHYEQYEISNFAKNKTYSRHNTNYWKNLPYLGVGPSAHSFNSKTRQWNAYSVSKYIQNIKDNKMYHNIEVLSTDDSYNEYIMLGLRTKWGIDRKIIKENFGKEYSLYFENLLLNPNVRNFVSIDGNVVILNLEGKKYADRVASNLFI